jgi:hypothetical protein
LLESQYGEITALHRVSRNYADALTNTALTKVVHFSDISPKEKGHAATIFVRRYVVDRDGNAKEVSVWRQLGNGDASRRVSWRDFRSGTAPPNRLAFVVTTIRRGSR